MTETSQSEKPMTVEFLYFDDCPNHEAALQRLRSVMARLGIQSPVRLVNVVSEEQARRERFLGSPSIRINGRDLEEDAATPDNFGRRCRIYFQNGKPAGLPPEELLVEAFRRAGFDPDGGSS